MIAMLLFSAIATALVFLAGRGDKARDPRLTVVALSLLALFPLLVVWVPKADVLSAASNVTGGDGFPWMKFLYPVWAAGSLVTVLRLGLAARVISNWRNRSILLDRIDGVEIRRLPGLKGPVAAGVVRPVVFVPAAWDSWSDDARSIVLEHELAHHRRRDPLWRWVAGIACAVSGCNPLVIWMDRRLTLQCEFACDARVLENGVPVAEYAKLLCDFAEDRPSRGLVLAMAGRSSLESRVRRLVGPRKPQGGAGLLALIALSVISAGVLASLGAARQAEAVVSKGEVDLRWSANPFPGEN